MVFKGMWSSKTLIGMVGEVNMGTCRTCCLGTGDMIVLLFSNILFLLFLFCWVCGDANGDAFLCGNNIGSGEGAVVGRPILE